MTSVHQMINLLRSTQKQTGQLTFMVDLDKEKGRPGGRQANVHRVQVRLSKTVDLHPLQAYLAGQVPIDNVVLEAITFIDHVLRAYPSEKLLSIKRSFFNKQLTNYKSIGGGVVAVKGVYQSLRPAQGGQLIVNADVANSCFWHPGKSLYYVAIDLIPNARDIEFCDMILGYDKEVLRNKEFVQVHKNTKGGKALTRMNKMRFRVQYEGMPESLKGKTYMVDKLLGTNALETHFEQTNKETGETRRICIYDYFEKQYDICLEFPQMPIVKTKRGACYPLEFCFAVEGERYPFKVSELQTAEMIKFAVTKPDVRQNAVYQGLKAVNWGNDPYFNHYKMKIDEKMITTNARLLQPPEVEFAKGKTEKPGTSGRWRIDGKQFIQTPPDALKNWGVMVLDNFGRSRSAPFPAVQQFIVNFIGEYQKYGGTVVNRQPKILQGHPDVAKCVEVLWETIAKECKPPERPQLLIFIVNAKSTDPYNRLKKSADCRYGVVSQVMQAAHVQKNQTQYIGNVLMKVNAKLGGFSFRSLSAGQKPNSGFTHFKTPTMVIGADVSHPGPGSLGASMAAVSVSMDKYGARYAAACQSNGSRIEMISTWNMMDMLRPIFHDWIGRMGGTFPQHVIYMRDGVSEGQFQHVLHQELRDLKAVFEDLPGGKQKILSMKFTVIVASKRHHVRFFPKAPNRDNNNNPFPGTLVERDVTTPFLWDFYLCAHRAIQGTARPVHYTVLHDEKQCSQDWLIKMIYEHSYQYVRSSTPVSVHPAIYYAHLAARRAVAHERQQDLGPGGPRTSEAKERDDLIEAKQVADQTGKRLKKDALARLKVLTELEHPRLIPMYDMNKITRAMWYV